MPQLPETRYSLLARLTEPADVQAWSEFVETYERAIWRYSRSRGLQEADAWEVVQQVLLIVHQKIGNWRPNGQPGAFRCWLLRTAHWICLRAFRDQQRGERGTGGEEFLDDVLPDRTPDPRDPDWERWAFCWAAGLVQREVEPSTWQAFWLTAVEGVSAADAARQVGLKIGTVYTAKCRILARMRELVLELSRGDL